MPRSALVSNNRILGDLGHNRSSLRQTSRLRRGDVNGCARRRDRSRVPLIGMAANTLAAKIARTTPPAEAGPCSGKYLLGRRQLAMKPALGIGLHGINVDLRLVDEAAFRASQGPMLKAGTRRDSALDCHERLASGTARKLGGARRQFGRRRLQIGHGIDPGKVTIGDYITGSRCWGSRAPALGRHFLRARRSGYRIRYGALQITWPCQCRRILSRPPLL